MRRRSNCAAVFRDGTGRAPVIGKVLRGRNAGRLLYYLYGPGKANEHTDPHLVAGFADPKDLEPERRRNGSRDFRRLSGLLAQPLAALAGSRVRQAGVALRRPRRSGRSGCCRTRSGRRSPRESWTGPGWHRLVMTWGCGGSRSGTPPITFTWWRRWPARTAPGRKIWNDFYRVREACQDAEARFGLRSTAPADRTAARRPARAETEQAARRRWARRPG